MLKKTAAIITAATLLTTPALALDLQDYPENLENPQIIVGEGSTDTAIATELALGLPQEETPEGFERSESLAPGQAFNRTNDFTNTLDADDMQGFQDTTIDIDIDEVDDDYDVRDEIRFGGDFISNEITIETGLTFDGDEDWKDKVFAPMRQNSWGYFYVFEDNLRPGNFLNDSDTDDEIEIEFLGKRFEIEGTANTANNLVINVGQRFYMQAGDTVVVDGKELSLIQTATSAATVEVDGVREVINDNDEEIVNGLEIRIEDVSSDEGIEYDSATIFAGEDARETYLDGEEFIGEDEDDPAWVWKLANLTGNQPQLGILWHLDLDSPDEDDNPLYEHPLYKGESICLPFDYACIIFDSIKIDDYQDYEIETNEVTDLYLSVQNSTNNNKDVTGERILELTAKGSSDDGFHVCSAYLNDNGGNNTCATTDMTTETDRVSIAVYSNYSMTGLQAINDFGSEAIDDGSGAGNFPTGTLLLFRQEQDGSDEILFNIVQNGTVNNNAFRIEYKNTILDVGIDATNAGIGCTETGSGRDQSQANWSMFIQPESRGKNLSIYFETDQDNTDCTNANHNDIRYLGHSDSDTVTARDLIHGDWVPNTNDLLDATAIDISGKEEDLRNGDGIIILDPKAHQSSDDIELRIPESTNDFKAKIYVRTNAKATVTTPQIETDQQVQDDRNLLIIGGPAINKVAADLLGLPFPSYGTASGLNPGEAKIKIIQNGNKHAILAYGYSKEDTKRAAKMLKEEEELTGTEITLQG